MNQDKLVYSMPEIKALIAIANTAPSGTQWDASSFQKGWNKFQDKSLPLGDCLNDEERMGWLSANSAYLSDLAFAA